MTTVQNFTMLAKPGFNCRVNVQSPCKWKLHVNKRICFQFCLLSSHCLCLLFTHTEALQCVRCPFKSADHESDLLIPVSLAFPAWAYSYNLNYLWVIQFIDVHGIVRIEDLKHLVKLHDSCCFWRMFNSVWVSSGSWRRVAWLGNIGLIWIIYATAVNASISLETQ